MSPTRSAAAMPFSSADKVAVIAADKLAVVGHGGIAALWACVSKATLTGRIGAKPRRPLDDP